MTDSRPRILVVDADDDLRATLCELLGDVGYRASCVPDIQTVRARLPGNAPSVLLLCWDTREDAREKKALLDEVPSDTAIVLMSTSPATASVAEELGVAFVPKPFDIDDFLATVERASAPPQ